MYWAEYEEFVSSECKKAPEGAFKKSGIR